MKTYYSIGDIIFHKDSGFGIIESADSFIVKVRYVNGEKNTYLKSSSEMPVLNKKLESYLTDERNFLEYIDQKVIDKGKKLVNTNAVKGVTMNIDGDRISCNVVDGHTFETSILWTDNFAVADCNCGNYDCEHEAALCFYMQEQLNILMNVNKVAQSTEKLDLALAGKIRSLNSNYGDVANNMVYEAYDLYPEQITAGFLEALLTEISKNIRGYGVPYYYETLLKLTVLNVDVNKILSENPRLLSGAIGQLIGSALKKVANLGADNQKITSRNVDDWLLFYYANKQFKEVILTFLKHQGRNAYCFKHACKKVPLDEELYQVILDTVINNERYGIYLFDDFFAKMSYAQLKQLISYINSSKAFLDYGALTHLSPVQRVELLKYSYLNQNGKTRLLGDMNEVTLDEYRKAAIYEKLLMEERDSNKKKQILKQIKKLPDSKYLLHFFNRLERNYNYLLVFDEKTINVDAFFKYFKTSFVVEPSEYYEDKIETLYFVKTQNDQIVFEFEDYGEEYNQRYNNFDLNLDYRKKEATPFGKFAFHVLFERYKDDVEKAKEEIKIEIEKAKDLSRSKEAEEFLEAISDEIDKKQILLDASRKGRLGYYFDFFDDELRLSLKIGIDKLYVVKNHAYFLDYFKNNETVKYGKNFQFTHSLDNLRDVDQKVMSLLMRTVSSTDSVNCVFINKDLAESIFELLKGEAVSINDTQYLVKLDEQPLKFKVDSDYRIQADCDFSNAYVMRNRVLLMDEAKKEVNYASIDKNQEVYQFLIDNIGTKIESFKDRFKEVVYSRLNNVITVDPALKDDFKLSEMKINAYFDFDDSVVTLINEYIIDDHKVREEDIARSYDKQRLNQYQSYLFALGFRDNTLSEESSIINFLSMDFSRLKQYCSVFLSESLQRKKLMVFTPAKIKINYKNNIMSAFLEESQYSEDELNQILKAIKKKKKYVLMSNDRIVDISNQDATDFLNTVEDIGLKKGNLYKETAVSLSTALKGFAHEQNVELDDYLLNMVSEIAGFKEADMHLPEINGELRQYQKEAFNWLKTLNKYHLGGILADDMGLGKTLEIITLIKDDCTAMPNLIVCPKSLVFNWVNEFGKFTNDEKVVEIYGSKKQRESLISEINYDEKCTYITSYDSLRQDVDIYKGQFNYCIIDEAQYIKNVMAQKTQSVKQLNSAHRIALTGTPIENDIIDLWSIFDFIMPGFFESLDVFKTRYNQNPDFVEMVAKRIGPFVLRRTKEAVLTDLPEKYERILSSEMTSGQRKVYDAFIKSAKAKLEDGAKAFDILPYLTRLRQICIDPGMFVDNYSGDSGKMQMLDELLHEYLNHGHRILIFSQFVKALNRIEEMLAKKKVPYFMITGDTDAKVRMDICNAFNNNSTEAIVLISLKAGGTGLNLIGADTVIHLDPWWNVAAENQASDRTYRIGQVKNVEVIKMICENSVEQRVVELQNIKKDLIDRLISNDDSSVSNASLEDIKFILG